MDVDNQNINNIEQHMPAAASSITMIFVKNATYLLALMFYPIMNWIIAIMPNWKDDLENFKLVGGAVIVVLVITKLILEIIKLAKK